MSVLVLVLALVAGQTGDIVTSCQALGTGRYVEANPLLPSTCGGVVLVKGAVTAGAAIAVGTLHRRHKGYARLIAITYAGVGVYATVHNLRARRTR